MIKNLEGKPLVSVIVPVFNVEKYVGQCIKSIYNQTYTKLEIILVNDGSTDGSLSICQKWAKKDRRIKIIEEKNSGLSAARNNGLTVASGQYVLFVDSDDWIAEKAVEKMVHAFCKYDADMVTCQFFYCGATSHISFKLSTQVEILNKEEYVKELLKDNKITAHIWRKMFKKELMPQHPFWEGHMFEDIAAMPELVNNCNKFVLLSDPLYYYRSRSSSFTRTQSKLNYIEQYKSTQKALRLYKDMNLNINDEIANYSFIRYWTIFRDMVEFNVDDKKLKKALIRELKEQPIKALPFKSKVICLGIQIMPADILAKLILL